MTDSTATAEHRRTSAPRAAAFLRPPNPYRVPKPAVISFSGGRTSAYLLKRIVDAYGGRLPDGVFVAFSLSRSRDNENYIRPLVMSGDFSKGLLFLRVLVCDTT